MSSLRRTRQVTCEKGTQMLGPLPRLYRLLLVVAAIGFCVGAGAWLASWAPIPVVAPTGASIGAVVGIGVAYLLAHDFSTRPRPLRTRRH